MLEASAHRENHKWLRKTAEAISHHSKRNETGGRWREREGGGGGIGAEEKDRRGEDR